ncbi:IclR family transcriptional regulator [Telmatospirillum sp. J64-1]|uniref:IclR family transcriptional regulator n=1 Tax=Telmatospirillum sp. J64-1 TaxID=2502183 RepID=UPI00115E5413|nr:IclR family transcriptional regulator [Telmatospirillum sp. J64-1]
MEEDRQKDRRGIQSIEVGGRILQALARSGLPMMLKDLAREAGMSAAKAHPYLVSFGKIGLIEQDPLTGRYEVGPLALQLGLVSLQRLDPVRIASGAIAALSSRIGHSVAIAVWGSLGPTIVRVEESSHPLHVNLRTGSVMSLLNTATGRVFAAYMPRKLIESLLLSGPRLLGDERAAVESPDWNEIEPVLTEVRRQGLSRALGNPIPGINAFSAPVFDHSRNIVLAVTAMGPSGIFDADWNSSLAQDIRACAADISHRLGYVGETRAAG